MANREILNEREVWEEYGFTIPYLRRARRERRGPRFLKVGKLLQVSECSNSYGFDFCTYNGTQWIPIEQTLTTLSAQGYELVSVVNFPAPGAAEQTMLYTLRAPVAGQHRKEQRSSVQ